jgi:S-adenosylmethionine:diacylglycerol 3-amino-3-carboxypropyl transferase
MTEEVVERLDRLTALIKIAHADAIERTRERIRADKVNAAILDGSQKWTPSGKLSSAVTKKTRTGTSTFKSRVADLLDGGLLEKRGGGPTTEYKATGLI